MITTNLISPISGKIRVPKKNIIVGNDSGIGEYYPSLDLSLLPLLRETGIIIGSKDGNATSDILLDFRYDINYLKRQHKRLCEILAKLSKKNVLLDGANVSEVFNIGGQSFDFFSSGIDANTLYTPLRDRDLINQAITRIEGILTAISAAGLVTKIAISGFNGINLMDVVREVGGNAINRGLLLLDRIQNNPVIQLAVPFLQYLPVEDEEDPNEPIEMGEDEDDLLLGYQPPALQGRLLEASTVRRARRFKRINRNFLPNLTSGKIWIGDEQNRPIEANPCCEKYEDAFFLTESLTAEAKNALSNAISLSELANGKSGHVVIKDGKIGIAPDWSWGFDNLSLGTVISVGSAAFSIFSAIFAPEAKAASYVFDVAKLIGRSVATGRLLQETTDYTIQGFRSDTSNLTDLIITYAVLAKTQILVGKNKDGTDLEGYDSPISGYGFVSPPNLEKSTFQSWIDWFFGHSDPAPAQINLDFKPKKTVSFNDQGIDSLSHVVFSKEKDDLVNPQLGTLAKDGNGLAIKTSSGWEGIGGQKLKQWTTATIPDVNGSEQFGVNVQFRTA